ncbi:glutathione S-transferase theta 2B [Phyllostomus discolor]|uniref:glutathione transferase n=1 Tax=Phyllostomus discolor TaxID=89673 RepID=A0A6J2MX15_9CHIR|nr:glutathione S-transferase theta-2B-like [Phyllostomus discolor]KAF6081339.1 glutathione S-transferase theta 2B [Phyllostomus discolor]
MGLELYLDLLSQPSRAVYIFAKKNGIPFQLRALDLLKGHHLNPEFLPANSLQRVPVLKDGDFLLTESVAILIYLSIKYQTADHWYPSDLQARMRIHEYLGWHGDCIRSTFGVSLWAQVLAPLIGIQVPEEKLKRNRAAMDRALQCLEDKFLGDKAFLTGQQVTLADIMALEELMQAVAIGCDLFEGRPRLAAWRQRVEAFLGADLCRETHSVIWSIRELAANKKLPDPPPEMRSRMLLRIARIP